MSHARAAAAGAALAVLAASLAGCAQDPADATIVEIDASRYQYAPSPINASLGSVVVFRITSLDVTHGFAIEGLGIQEEIPAGQTIDVRVKLDRAGDFTIYCTVFCGPGHPQHKGTLHVA